MRQIRISIVMIVTILLCLGMIMIYSSSSIYALAELGQSTYFLNRHVLYLLIGTCLCGFLMAVDYRHLQRLAKPLLLMALVMLVFVLIPGIGQEHNGARRWFRVGAFSFQPSEFAKFAVLVYLADFLSRKHEKIRNFKEGFLPVMLMLGIFCCLIVKQPDLGTSVSLAVVTLIMIFIAGARISHLMSLVVLALPLVYVLIVHVPYRMARIMAFLDPWQDSQGIGFQLTQSQIALGSGGIFGVGLGKSLQKLFYLPAAHTDFIFSIIGEELGLIGTLCVMALFVIFLWQATRIAKRTQEAFGYYLAIGIVAIIALQTVVNIGVSIGALPTKGLPMPFVSYGGSALMFNLAVVGVLLNISRTQE